MIKHTLIACLLTIFILNIGCKKDDAVPSDYDSQILEEVNNHRLSEGLTPLEHSDFIWELAREHSLYMAGKESYSNHDGIVERYEKLQENFGYGAAGENVSTSSSKNTANEIVNLWLASVSHKQHLEGDFTLTGISAVKSEEGTWYYTQIFFKQ